MTEMLGRAKKESKYSACCILIPLIVYLLELFVLKNAQEVANHISYENYSNFVLAVRNVLAK